MKAHFPSLRKDADLPYFNLVENTTIGDFFRGNSLRSLRNLCVLCDLSLPAEINANEAETTGRCIERINHFPFHKQSFRLQSSFEC
jgi:hypothetical protein